MQSVRERLEKIFTRLDTGFSRANVFTKIYRDKARAEADAADSRRRAGLSLGPLDGAIVSIKDLFDIRGEVTLAGSKALRGTTAAKNDTLIVTRLRRAGAVIVGKTNMSEFAFTGLGINPHYGTPGNAVDPERIPGGSSSGAGVSVAEDTSDIGIGTDTGGSVRIPAAFNGIVGFKPSTGRIPSEGAFPLSYTLDSIGPLARTVQQCADADAAMAGQEPTILDGVDLSSLRIGIPRGLLFGDTEPLVAEGFENALRLLARTGVRVVDINLDDLIEAQWETIVPASIAAIEAAAAHAAMLDERADEYDSFVRERILKGRDAPVAAYIRILRRRAELVEAMDRRLSGFDALVLPTTPTVAPVTKRLLDDLHEYKKMNALTLRNTAMGNFFDLTGISLPLPGMALPAGFMMMARHGADLPLLAMAKSVEATFMEYGF